MGTRLSTKEAAEFTGLKQSTIYRYTVERKIPFYKIGTKILFDTDDLIKWLASKKVEVIKYRPGRKKNAARFSPQRQRN